ncbi:hypothetical protein [Tessaracoccus palaemonis]|uniref:Uncharacterized protein n=1 Tax=Tessaracoccus palaemonis TaxID=2829499 RepID=A0ABX8SK20_9ACTN|nr:hypothetical protein [Tessaracoccus palaemonis]QXT63668.1 hypothetical protein KDB89_04090 [Tessaracoccus palaemonis]
MIIWRGWGILAAGYVALTGIFGIGIPWSVGGASLKWIMLPVALVMAVACWFTGRYFNVVKPRRVVEQELPALRQQLEASVAAGTFRLANQPPPTSLEQARGQAEGYLQFISGQHHGRNWHTMFFLPMQYWAFLIAAWGVAMPLLVH